jgi:glutathione synthase/RimK-type ligase-like ATP-grasp enzyme
MLNQQKLGTAELLFRSAQKLGCKPSWIVPHGLFAITIDGTERYINHSHSPLNSHASISLARNKHLTRLILGRNGLPNIPFMRPKDYEEAVAFLSLHSTIIAKPIQGSGAQDINIITHANQLRPLIIKKYILEKYIVGQEMRYLVLNGSVIAVHRSEYGTSVDKDRYLERFSIPEPDWDNALVRRSIEIATIMDLKFAAIDYLVDAAGSSHILEVNSTPGLKWFHAPTAGPAVDVATLFLESLFSTEPLLHAAPSESQIIWHTQLA